MKCANDLTFTGCCELSLRVEWDICRGCCPPWPWPSPDRFAPQNKPVRSTPYGVVLDQTSIRHRATRPCVDIECCVPNLKTLRRVAADESGNSTQPEFMPLYSVVMEFMKICYDPNSLVFWQRVKSC